MGFNHTLLAASWIAYCAIHSLLAAGRTKLFIKKLSGSIYRYYRLAYTILAAVTLFAVLYFQYTMASPLLIRKAAIKYISLPILVFPGLAIMIISILKYFKSLSGIRSLYEAGPSIELYTKGIHKYVRHPLYSGTLLFVWGLFLIFPMLNNLIAVCVITAYVLIGTRFEEKKLLTEYGTSYAEYIAAVPMLIPNFKSRRK